MSAKYFEHTLTVDFETFFSADFTLRKLSTLEYIRDPKFKVHGAACKLDTAPAEWITSERLPEHLAAVAWDKTAAISHNSLFDQTILYEKYGISPVFRIDTLGLARALLPQDMDFDLDALALALGVGHKTNGGKALQATKGIRDLTPELEESLATYACNDAEVCYKFFETLWPHLPEIERRLLNTTLRMGTEGILRLNHATATEALTEAAEKRNDRILNGGQDSSIYRSDAKFADLLRSAGVEPPTKISPKTGKTGYAFSKQDPAFVALLEHPDVAAFVDARLATKSTSDIKRIERLKRITSMEPKTLPMPLNYCGAHTYRWSGGGKINPQNFKKGADGHAGKLRMSIEAPDEHMICVADSAQIELRMNLWWCGQYDLLDMLRNGEDLYSYTATNILERHVDKKMKTERNLGKVVELGAGFGLGARKFRALCSIGPMGNKPIHLSQSEAAAIIAKYREIHPYVKARWDWLSHFAIPSMTKKDCHIIQGPVAFEHERVVLPSGLALLYPNLHATDDGWEYGINGVRHRLWGGTLDENIVQALARVVVGEQLDLIDRTVARVVSMSHDEIICVAPEQEAEHVLSEMLRIMSITPEWAPNLPLAAEGGFAKEYSK